jgi:hypothetical protein
VLLPTPPRLILHALRDPLAEMPRLPGLYLINGFGAAVSSGRRWPANCSPA